MKRTKKRSKAGAGVAAIAASVLAVAAPAAAQTAQNPSVTRVSGENRFATSVQAAQAFDSAAPGDVNTVILASAETFPDALAASVLAGDETAPIVLTAQDGLTPEVEAYLRNVTPSTVFVIGGEAALGAGVVSDVRGLGLTGLTVNRIGGADRYETAAMVAREAGPVASLDGMPTALLATGANFPDALAAGGIAYQGHPILLTMPDQIPQTTLDAISALGLQQIVVVGGEGVVSPAIVRQLEDRGLTVMRVGGANRFETASNIANLTQRSFGFGNSRVSVANGERFPDALSAAPWNGQLRVPLVLATQGEVPQATRGFIQSNASTISDVTIFGGPSAISADTANVLQSAASASS